MHLAVSIPSLLGALSRLLFVLAGLGHVGGPQGQVIPQQLHDQSTVFVRLLRECVKLSNGIVESLLSQMTSLVWRILDLVVEDGEVQS